LSFESREAGELLASTSALWAAACSAVWASGDIGVLRVGVSDKRRQT
jgi:hypothetical protein